MFSKSLNNIERISSKNFTPKKIKIKKFFLGQITPNNSLKEKLPEIKETFTPRPREKGKENTKIKKIRFISPSPSKKKKFNSVENYLISTSLLSKYDDETSFDFSYFKRISNKYSPLISKKEIKPEELTNNTKKAFKKNLVINVLKNKREEVSKDEKLIYYSLKEYRRQIDKDFMNFMKINDEYKAMKRRENNILGYYRIVYQRTRAEYFLQQMNNKKLRDYIEKTIRDIYKLKEYAKFIHSMYGIPFILDTIDENLLYDNKFDILREQLINIYTEEALEKENVKKNNLLKDINLFMKNFILYENNIIHLLKEKNLIIKDIYYIKIDNKKRLQHLVKRKNDYIEDTNILKKFKNNFNNELLSSLGQAQNEQYDEFKNYIIQFTKIFDIPTSKNRNKDTEVEYYKYCKDIESVLREKENIIDKCTNEINEILNSENLKDRNLMESIISERKKYNLEILQGKVKENNLKKMELAKIKIMDKNGKKIIRGRMFLDYRFISLHKNDKKKEEELKEKNRLKNNDINIEYCLSEYDNKIYP